MSNWRSQILREFTPSVARLTLVADPDGLFQEEGVLAGIRERGFELVPFEDHVAFRYAYESKFRSRWDQGEQTDLVVVLRSSESDLGCLPYDLLQAGRRLSFNLGEIFQYQGDEECLKAQYVFFKNKEIIEIIPIQGYLTFLPLITN